MIVKKFQAPTETEAVLKARDELGSSAVVLNVKTLKQRGIFRLFRKDIRMSSFGDVSHLYAGGREPSFAARFCEVYTRFDQRHD